MVVTCWISKTWKANLESMMKRVHLSGDKKMVFSDCYLNASYN